jgi:hypothetical protein
MERLQYGILYWRSLVSALCFVYCGVEFFALFQFARHKHAFLELEISISTVIAAGSKCMT